MSDNKLFNSKEFFNKLFHTITVIYDNRGNIYSIGNQVAEKLGYSRPKKAIQENVPNEFKFFLRDAEKHGIADIRKFIPEKYKHANTTILKEPGVHLLVSTSRKPLARDFCIWLFSEVVPSIRKQGYFIDQSTYERKCNIIEVLKEKNEKLQKEIEDLTQRISEIKYSKHEDCMVKEMELLKEIRELKETIKTMRRK